MGPQPGLNWNLGGGFCGGRKTGETGEKPWSRDENQQQAQPTYDTGPESNRATLVGGE